MSIDRLIGILLILCCLTTNLKAQNKVLKDAIDTKKIDELEESLDYSKTKSIWAPRNSETKEVEKENFKWRRNDCLGSS